MFKRHGRGLLRIILVLALLFVAMEALSRLFLAGGAPAQFRPSSDPSLLYEYVPGLTYTYNGGILKSEEVDVRINSHGFRCPDFTDAQKEGVLRIAILGDSFAFGRGVDYENAFPAVLARLIKQKCPQAPCEVIDLGVEGYNLPLIANLAESSVRRFSPDLMIVTLYANDLTTVPKIFERYPCESGLMRAAVEHSRLIRLLYILTHLGSFSTTELDPYEIDRAMYKLSELGQGHRLVLALIEVPEHHNYDFKERARFWNLGVYDLSGLSSDPMNLLPHDPHFNALGHERFAERLFQRLMDDGLVCPKSDS